MLARAVPLVLLAAAAYLTLALRLPFGAVARPGADFYPVMVAALLGPPLLQLVRGRRFAKLPSEG